MYISHIPSAHGDQVRKYINHLQHTTSINSPLRSLEEQLNKMLKVKVNNRNRMCHTSDPDSCPSSSLFLGLSSSSSQDVYAYAYGKEIKKEAGTKGNKHEIMMKSNELHMNNTSDVDVHMDMEKEKESPNDDEPVFQYHFQRGNAFFCPRPYSPNPLPSWVRLV